MKQDQPFANIADGLVLPASFEQGLLAAKQLTFTENQVSVHCKYTTAG